MGALDFAGGIVIHVNAGGAALVSALVLGNRKGFPTTAMPPHNMTLVVTGEGMLWVGWYGFSVQAATIWSALSSYLILKLLDSWLGLRVTPDEHEETGYLDL